MKKLLILIGVITLSLSIISCSKTAIEKTTESNVTANEAETITTDELELDTLQKLYMDIEINTMSINQIIDMIKISKLPYFSTEKEILISFDESETTRINHDSNSNDYISIWLIKDSEGNLYPSRIIYSNKVGVIIGELPTNEHSIFHKNYSGGNIYWIKGKNEGDGFYIKSDDDDRISMKNSTKLDSKEEQIEKMMSNYIKE